MTKETSSKSLSSIIAYTIIVTWFWEAHRSEYTLIMTNFIRKSEIIDYTLDNLDILIPPLFSMPMSQALVYFFYMLVPMAFIVECAASAYLYLWEISIEMSNRRSIEKASERKTETRID